MKLRHQLDEETWTTEVPQTPKGPESIRSSRNSAVTKKKSPRKSSRKSSKGSGTARAASNRMPVSAQTPSLSTPDDGHLQILKERFNRLKAEDEVRKRRNSENPINKQT